MEKKHIAVYFSGRCVGYEHCYENLKSKFYDKYNVDFFWSIDEEKETPYYLELRKLLKPKAIYFEKIDKKIVDIPIASEETKQRNSLSMFFHNYHCTKMIMQYMEKNNVKYHVIVRFRAEIDSEDEFKIQDYIIPRTIYIPFGYNFRGVGDRIAYGDVNSMLVYGSLFMNIQNYVFHRQAIFNPEYLLMFHINECNMNLIRFPYKFSLHSSRHKIESEDKEKQFPDSGINLINNALSKEFKYSET